MRPPATRSARFLNASSTNEIVFLRGATEAINLVAQSWGRQHVAQDDEIVVSWLEHHANIVPWQQLANETGARLRVIPVDDDGQILLDDYGKLLGPQDADRVVHARLERARHHHAGASRWSTWRTVRGRSPPRRRSGGLSYARRRAGSESRLYVFSGHKVFAPDRHRSAVWQGRRCSTRRSRGKAAAA